MQQLFALSLGIAAMVFAASQSPAQTEGPALPPQCAGHAQVVQTLASRYGESRQAMGLASGDQLMEVFAAPSGTWTLTVTMPDGTTCLVASGSNFERLEEPLALNDPPA